jgi:hypothetical protein
MPMSPRLLRPRAAGGFDPRSIGGLQGWWDAADLSTMAQNSNGTTAATAASDPVGYWADKSGNGRHGRQTTNNNRPALQLADRNGLPGLNFDGSNDYFACDSGSAFSAAIVFAVLRRTASSEWGAIYVHRASSSSAGFTNSAQEFYVQQTQAQNGFLFGLTQAGGVLRRNGTAFTPVNSGVFGIQHANLMPNTTDTNVIAVQGNSTSTVGTQYPFISFDPFGTARVYPMRLYELLVYNFLPTAAQTQSIEGYLGRKWGITIA